MDCASLGRRCSLLFGGLAFILVLAGSALPCRAQSDEEKRATFFVGRLKYSSNDGNDCQAVAERLAELLGSASNIPIQKERKLRIIDPELFETPFLFMNGHNDFVLNNRELENLRKYFANGGFLLASGCCTNPAFPKAWRREFSRVFPEEKVTRVNYDHPIYKSFFTISRIPSLDGSEDIHLEGLHYQGSLVAVICEQGLCCSFAMDNECNKGNGIDPKVARKIALNIAVYSLTH